MTEYTDCELCGREIGHWLGCEGAAPAPAPEAPDPEPSPVPGEEPSAPDDVDPDDQCGRAGCTKARAPQGKGPRPKYCTEHKTGSK